MKESLDQLNAHAQRMVWEKPNSLKVDVSRLESQFEDSLHAQLNNCTLPGERAASQPLAEWCLGLSITKNIIVSHRGQIDFACPVGGGTIFRFQLPSVCQLAPVT
ncbi:MAG TPA: hypothetical protein VHX86_16085 [Tepidisphaeraceae bacterium]|jgi:light-regulated signal transduction histidine kinase (bacteriophytochrome)|nr:hypothetical protein [Tepidisphaeraceae bacterium]